MPELTKDAWYMAQVSVIGSLLVDPDKTAGMIFQQARPTHFGNPVFRHIFEAAQGLWAERKPIDPITLLHAAGDNYRDLLADCMMQTPTAANVEEYLAIIRSQSRLNAIRRAAYGFAEVQTEREALQIYENLGLILRDIDTIEDLSWTEMVNDYLDRMADPTPPDYLSWGIPQLDQVLFVSPGAFVVIAADSSVGKTALSLQFAYHMAATGKRVGFFSLETPKESLEDRLMAETQVANIPLPRTKSRALSSADFERAADAGQRSERVPLRMIRRADTLAEIQNRTVMHGFDVIFIDYLQLIEHEGINRSETVLKISMELHRMAQRLGVTVVALSQITPPEDGKDPTMDNLRESRQIKNDADVILMLMPDRNKPFPNARRLVIEKDKDGKKKRWLVLKFDPEHMTFAIGNRKELDTVPGQGAPMFDLADDEGGENPFAPLP
ncbi:MAG: AAA family ATPase [Oscillospiraceae bacterium]|nr:AAA family ATPase [Oscillospiraceae bacterium]